MILQILKIRQLSKLRDKSSRKSSIAKVPSIVKQIKLRYEIAFLSSRSVRVGYFVKMLKEKNAYTLVTLLMELQVT
jgi:hypothetical protein